MEFSIKLGIELKLYELIIKGYIRTHTIRYRIFPAVSAAQPRMRDRLEKKRDMIISPYGDKSTTYLASNKLLSIAKEVKITSSRTDR